MKYILIFIFLSSQFINAQIVDLDEDDIARMEFSGVFKSALSIELGGGTGFAGLAFDHFLREKLRMGISVGYPATGANFKVYPFGIDRHKACWNIGWRSTAFLTANDPLFLMHNLPIGISVFGKNQINFEIDFGPAYSHALKSTDVLTGFSKNLYFWGGVKIGYRFSFYSMKRARQLNKLD
ncbi:hypothetical protein [Crocinitomix catalasitica]|uniref:hypothetical protein n=1 Tax=Crocinitomix catalasitica TaxID=184607 RepID=UPI000487AF42|nr:hypothetical protein [Crocinitomix catalasitica]